MSSSPVGEAELMGACWSPSDLLVNSPHMVLHVVHPAEHSPTLLPIRSPPLTSDGWIMRCLVPGSIFLRPESSRSADGTPFAVANVSRCRLRAALHSAEEVF